MFKTCTLLSISPGANCSSLPLRSLSYVFRYIEHNFWHLRTTFPTIIQSTRPRQVKRPIEIRPTYGANFVFNLPLNLMNVVNRSLLPRSILVSQHVALMRIKLASTHAVTRDLFYDVRETCFRCSKQRNRDIFLNAKPFIFVKNNVQCSTKFQIILKELPNFFFFKLQSFFVIPLRKTVQMWFLWHWGNYWY